MAFSNITGDIIARGFDCLVRVGTSHADAEPVAFVSSFQANEDFQVQEATVLGNLGPVSLDPQGYNCTITCRQFIPAKKLVNKEQQYADGGKTSFMDLMPTRATFMTSGAVPKLEYLEFVNHKEGDAVLASFTGVIVTSDGLSADGNGYVSGDVSMRALTKN